MGRESKSKSGVARSKPNVTYKSGAKVVKQSSKTPAQQKKLLDSNKAAQAESGRAKRVAAFSARIKGLG